MTTLISLRNLYITRLILTGLTQGKTGQLFSITGGRTGVLAHNVCKKLMPVYYPITSGKTLRSKSRSLKYYMQNLRHKLFAEITNYEKKYYSSEREIIQKLATSKEAIKTIKELTHT